MIILPVLVASYKWTLVTTIYPQDSGLSKFQVNSDYVIEPAFGSISNALLFLSWIVQLSSMGVSNPRHYLPSIND